MEIVVPKAFAEMAAVVSEFLERPKASKVFPTFITDLIASPTAL